MPFTTPNPFFENTVDYAKFLGLNDKLENLRNKSKEPTVRKVEEFADVNGKIIKRLEDGVEVDLPDENFEEYRPKIIETRQDRRYRIGGERERTRRTYQSPGLTPGLASDGASLDVDYINWRTFSPTISSTSSYAVGSQNTVIQGAIIHEIETPFTEANWGYTGTTRLPLQGCVCTYCRERRTEFTRRVYDLEIQNEQQRQNLEMQRIRTAIQNPGYADTLNEENLRIAMERLRATTIIYSDSNIQPDPEIETLPF